MRCARPFNRLLGERVSQWPCYSKCLPCLINRKRIWTHRLILESLGHEASSFATLTYEDGRLPSDGNVHVGHYQNWLKRLRKIVYPNKIRYFLSAEYGEKSLRPHYHAVVFGLDPVIAGGLDGRSGVVSDAWNSGSTGGFTYVGTVTPESCAYVAGYVVKKLKGSKDEFQRMSLRPGIGKDTVLSIMNWRNAGQYLDSLPTVLRHGKSGFMPLGRYLRGQISNALAGYNMGDTFTKDPREQVKERLLELRSAYEEAKKVTSKTPQEIMLDARRQELCNLTKKYELLKPLEVL